MFHHLQWQQVSLHWNPRHPFSRYRNCLCWPPGHKSLCYKARTCLQAKAAVRSLCQASIKAQAYIYFGQMQCMVSCTAFAQNKYTPELLWKLGRVSEPQLSPEGKYVLYSIRTYDLAANKGNSDIWRMDASGSNAMKLAATANDETSARWLNQNKIMFVSDESGSSQLWTMNADGSGKKQITKIFDGINEYGFNSQANMIW